MEEPVDNTTVTMRARPPRRFKILWFVVFETTRDVVRCFAGLFETVLSVNRPI